MKKIPLAMGCIGTIAALSFGAFTDDFSNEAESNTLWTKNNDAVMLTFANSACKVVNSDTNFIGYARHAFAANDRRETFTLSGSVTLGSGAFGAGFSVCVAASGMPTGYYISIIENDRVTVNKIDSTGAGTEVVTVGSAFLTSGTNELAISRKEGTFNIFCNGEFTVSFTDSDFSSGDIGLLVSPGSNAVFDDIVMTDTFKEGAPRTCFADDFSSEALTGWDWFGSSNVSVGVENEALHVVTEASQSIYQVFDLPLTDFVLRTVVSHRGGSSKNFYGLFVCGRGEASIPLAGFGINGGSNYGTFLAGEALTPTASTSIKGDPYISSTGDTTYYTDTLEVIKRAGTDNYLFVVNSDTLKRFIGVDFMITGAGIFCLDSLNLIFDDFLVANGTEAICPVREPVAMRRGGRAVLPIVLPAEMPLFDLSGRLVSRRVQGMTSRVSGVYLQRTGKLPARRLDIR
jgi:hypothetical protein